MDDQAHDKQFFSRFGLVLGALLLLLAIFIAAAVAVSSHRDEPDPTQRALMSERIKLYLLFQFP